jgi:hypothetical protein
VRRNAHGEEVGGCAPIGLDHRVQCTQNIEEAVMICHMIASMIMDTSCTGNSTTVIAYPLAAHLFAKAWIHDNPIGVTKQL